jgi:hypothetical protein
MDPYAALGISPTYRGDLRARRNALVKRYSEAGETPDEERMKAINLAYALLTGPAQRPAGGPLSIATTSLPGARVGDDYRAQLAAAGGAAPYAWTVRLPAGLTVGESGAISGRLERPGTFPLALTVTDTDGRMAERVLVLHVAPPSLRLHDRALPNATIGVPYEAELPCDGGIGPLRWSGAPPAGLQLGDGLLFGTPLGPSACVSLELEVRDAARQRVTAVFELVVRPAWAAADVTEWTPERLHDEQVARREAGVDRARIAWLRRRLARRPLDRNAIAATILVTATAAALLVLLVGMLAVAPAAAALAYAIGPALLAPARREELERLESLLGCGRAGCARCLSGRPRPGSPG